MSNPLTLLVDVKGENEWIIGKYVLILSWMFVSNIECFVRKREVWVIELREYIRGIYASRGM